MNLCTSVPINVIQEEGLVIGGAAVGWTEFTCTTLSDKLPRLRSNSFAPGGHPDRSNTLYLHMMTASMWKLPPRAARQFCGSSRDV